MRRDRDDWDDDIDDMPPVRRRRETIMDRRLRRSQGEEVDDAFDDYDDEGDDEGYMPRSLYRPDDEAPYRRGGGGGCAWATLYLVAGALLALVIAFFFFNQALSGIGNALGGLAPNIAELTASPTPTIRMNSVAVVQRIQQLSRLETTAYTVERVIEAEQTEDRIPLIGNLLRGDRLLLVAHGQVVAGVDLSKLTEADVTLSDDGTTVTLRLPPAEIFSATLDNERTRVYDRQRGWFAPDNRDLESLARLEAESEILRSACEGGILVRATREAENALENLLELLDFQQVEVIAAPIGACVPSPGATPTP